MNWQDILVDSVDFRVFGGARSGAAAERALSWHAAVPRGKIEPLTTLGHLSRISDGVLCRIPGFGPGSILAIRKTISGFEGGSIEALKKPCRAANGDIPASYSALWGLKE